MKKYSFLFLILFVIMVLVSCSNSSTKSTKSNIAKNKTAVKHVNFMGQWMNEGKREFIVRDFVREFEFLHQDIEVNLKFPEEIGFDRYNTTSTHAYIYEILKQGVPEFDVILINDDVDGIANSIQDKEWAKRYLVDFSAYPELARTTIPEIDLDKVKKRWGGIIPGPFLEGQYWALWTNKNVAKKLGIEVKQYGMTFEDFKGYLQAVNKYNENSADKIVPYYEAGDWTSTFFIAQNMYLSLLGENYQPKEGVSFEQFRLDAWYKTLQAIEELSAYNMMNENWRTEAWGNIKNKLVEEQCLFFSNGSWMYNTWLESYSDKVMNCIPNEPPTFGSSPIIYPGGFPIMWGVLKSSPNKEQAVQFLLEMSQPAMAENWVRNTKCPTGIKGNVASASFGVDQYEDFSYHVKTKYGSNLFKMQDNSFFIFGDKHAYEPHYTSEVLNGVLTADEAMNKIYARINELNQEELTQN